MGRAPCCDKNGLKKGPWTPEEDARLISHIQTHGPGNWRTLPKNAGLQRCGKSCRLRWTNYLRPDIKRGRFSFEEEETIIQLHSILGNKWSAIAARLPGRTDNEIKNYWNTHIRKRLLRSGIDPVTHAPRLDLLDLSSLLTSSLCNPSLLNVSNLLRTQALINPDILRLASTILSLKNSESIQDNLFPQNTNLQNINNNAQLLINQLQPLIQQQEVPSASVLNQTQPNVHVDNVVSSNMTDLAYPIPQENFPTTSSGLEDHNLVSQQPNYVECNNTSNPMACSVNGLLESLNYQLMNNNNNSSTDQNMGGFESVLSTPLSSPNHPLNSSSTFINSSTEDERDSYCSNLFQFHIPESLDLDDFM